MKNYFEENTATAGLAKKSVRGGAITLIARGIIAVIQIGSVLFLARLLSPEDYGLVAMVTAVTGFAPIFVDLGTRDAVVQRKSITEDEVSALFWLTLGIGVTFALIISALGPVLAAFYHEPRITRIVLLSSLTFIAAALTSQPQALLRRAVRFRGIALVEVTATLLSVAIAVFMAFRGFGYWALVIRPVAMNIFIALGMWSLCRWVPKRGSFTKGVKEMCKFGLNSTGFSLVDFVGRNADRIAIGRGLGARTLGFYQNAGFIYDNLLDILVYPLHQVAVASLSKLQNDLVELKRAWKKALSVVAFYAMPVFAILAVTSQDVVVVVLGSKWASAGTILSILALRGIPHSVERTLGWLHVTAGRPDRWVRWGTFAMFMQLGALFCGLPFGTMGIATAYVVCASLMALPALTYAGKPLDIHATDVIDAVGRQAVGAVVAAAAGFALRYTILAEINSYLRIASLTIAFLAVYLLIVVGLLKVHTPLRVIWGLVSDLIPFRRSKVVEAQSAATNA